MSSAIAINEFIPQMGKSPLIDVRSESEFRQGHIPGAINIPVLNDGQRKEVGITYKQKGRREAVIKGFDLAGPSLGKFIIKAGKISSSPGTENINSQPFFLYCWRGGMRSSIAGWLLSLARFRVLRLEGGYKSFRKWALETLESKRNILVLGGMTGSGKTEVLRLLSAMGESVIDLEQMAHHKGSAFGGLGQPLQPTTEHFENLLALKWAVSPENGRPFIWMENESRTIGHNQLPNSVYDLIRKSPVLEITVSREKRLERILNEYGPFPADQLIEKTNKLKKRLGGQHLRESLEYLANNNLGGWASKMLDYYDKAYSYGMEQRQAGSVFSMKINEENYDEAARDVREKGNALMKKIFENEPAI